MKEVEIQVSEYCIDLTEESDEEEKKESPSDNSLIIVLDDDKDETNIKKKVKKTSSPKKGKIKKSKPKPIDYESPEYFAQLLEKAVADIKKGGSLMSISVQYGIPEEVLYQKLVSRTLPDKSKLLTKFEEKNLVKWIVSSNRENSVVFKNQLLERVGRYKKVAKITPIFSKSKFGRMWYQHFLRIHPEIYENDGILMPTNDVNDEYESEDDEWGPSTSQWPDEDDIKLAYEAFGSTRSKIKKDDTTELLLSLGIRNSVVILHDFRKQKNSPFKLDEKGSTFIPTIKKEIEGDDIKMEVTVKDYNSEKNNSIKSEKPDVFNTFLNISDSELEFVDYNTPEICHVKLNESDSDIDNNTEESEVCHPQLNESESDIENNREEIEKCHIQLNESESDIETTGTSEQVNGNCISELKHDANTDECTIGRDISNLPVCTEKKRKCRKRKNVTNLDSLKCKKCGKTFNCYSRLKRHLYIHMPLEQYAFSCIKCLKKFPFRYKLKNHFNTVHSRIFFKCTECHHKIFKHRTSLRNHLRHCHFNLFEQNGKVSNKNSVFFCDICGKEYKNKSNLEGHIRYTHMKEDFHFVCDICGKRYKSKASLQCHVRYIHMKEEKHFSCNVCKRRFIKHSAMLRHKLRHTKIKKFACSHCHRTFSRKYLLREHIQVCKERKEEIKSNCNKISKDYLINSIKLE